ncbi:MAG: D-glycero-beta-D-manno-heptose-7-phosphate kinase [Oligoflexia bacterium]|nr:D-glycero-beta-D-manno-heptose-7-phosphate kinase [Oligoflexia bacterium]
MTANIEKLTGLVDQLKNRKILIIGDVGLDEYVIGTVRRISPEAPVPIVEVQEEDKRLGLSGNVAANVASLGGNPLLLGIVGDDGAAEIFRQQLKRDKCSSDYLVVDESRPTTRKLRVMAGQHHVVRVDFERKKFLSPEMEEKLLSQVKKLIPQCDGVILEDYAKGMLTARVIQEVIKIAHEHKKIVTLDPHHTTPIDLYKGVDYMTPNTSEALALSELKIDDLRSPSDTLHEVGEALLKRTQARAVVVTRGKDGMSIFSKLGPAQGQHIPTFAQSVFDVTGAGDTVIATLTLALTAGIGLEDACLLSNYAAGVVVGKIGCVSAEPTELKTYIREHKI